MADGRIIIDTELNTAEFEGGLKQLDALTVAAGTVIGNVLGAGIGKLKDFATETIQSGMKFDAAMSNVAAISGATGKEFDALRDKAQEMGAKTRFSASESADAFSYMAMAGWKTEDMLSGIDGIMNLAAASGEDLALTSDIVTDALTAFRMTAADSSHFADVLAAASSNANTNVSMLGESFKYAAPVAGALGINAEDTSLALGLMANAGIKASQAGTYLRTGLSNLAKPTKQMQAYMDQYNIALVKNKDGSVNLRETMSDLRNKMGGLSETEQAAAASAIFGKEAMAGWLAIVNGSDKDFDKLTGAIDNCEGTARRMADEMENNLAGDVTKFQSALDGLRIAISDQVSPSLRNLVTAGTNAVSDLTAAMKTDGVGGMLRVAGEMGLSLIQGFAAKVPGLLQSGVDAAVSLIEGLSSGLAGNVTSFLNQALPMLMEFSGQLRKNAGQLIDAGLGLIMQLAKGIADGLPAMIQTIPTIVTNIAGIINDNAPKILTTGIKIIGTLAVGIIKAIPTLVANIPKIIQAFVAVLMAFNWINLGSSIITGISNGVRTLASELPNAIKNIGETAFTFFRSLNWANLGTSLIQAIQYGIVSIGSMVWTALTGIADVAISSFLSINWLILGKELVLGIIYGIAGLANTVITAIVNLGKAILDGFKSFFGIHSPSSVMMEQGRMLVQGLVNALQAMPGAISGILSNALSAVAKWGTNLAKKALNAAKTMLKNVVNHVKQLPGKVGTQLNNVIKNVTKWASDLVSKAKDAASKTLSNVVSFFRQMPGRVGSQLSSVISKVSSWASSMVSKARDAASKALSGVVSNISKMPGKVGSQLSSVVSKVSSWASGFQSKMKNAASHAVSGLVKQVSKLPGKVSSQLSKVLSKAASFGSKMKSKFTSIGKNAINGVISGIKGSVGRLYSSIKNALSGLVKKAKDALGIKSPSKVLRDEVGQWIPAGVAQGITDNIPVVNQAMAALTNGVATSLKKADGSKQGETYAKSIINAIKGNKKYAKKSAAEVGEAIVSTAEKKLKNYQTVHNPTVAYEVGFWEKIVKSCKKGTQAYYDAYTNYASALAEYNDGMASAKADLLDLENGYANNVLEVENNLVNEMNELWNAYYDAVDQRSKELFSSLGGLFDGFESKTENTTASLLSNLSSQVDGMKDWQKSLNTLQARGLDEGLLESIRELGPEAAADVAVLTQLTDEELKQYQALWKEKMELCNAQATAENKDLYDSTVEQIRQLKEDASAQLAEYTNAFVAEVQELGKQTKKKLGALPKSFQNVGKQAVKGLTNALKDGSGSISKEVSALMKSAVSAAKKTLKIKSPSRVFQSDVGAQIVAGVEEGMQQEESGLFRQMEMLSNHLVEHAHLPDFSGYVNRLRNVVSAEVGTVTVSAVATTRSGAGVVPGRENQVDYKKLAAAVTDALDAAGLKVELNNRELGRLISTRG